MVCHVLYDIVADNEVKIGRRQLRYDFVKSVREYPGQTTPCNCGGSGVRLDTPGFRRARYRYGEGAFAATDFKNLYPGLERRKEIADFWPRRTAIAPVLSFGNTRTSVHL